MKNYFLRVLATALVCMFSHYVILLCIRSPLPAEYWIHEFIVVKRYQAAAMPSPKIIFVGGSCTLFGIDAAEVQKSLEIPAINFGLSAAMRLEDHLAGARSEAKPGDIVILSLEPTYYDYYTTAWTTWNLRNALAWDRASLDSLPITRRLQIYFESSDISISWDLLSTKIAQRFSQAQISKRTAALGLEPAIIARYLANRETSQTFAFDISNLDANGDLLKATSNGPPFRGDAWAPIRPVTISPYAESVLVPFLTAMKSRQVRVFFDYTPYLVFEKPDANWKQSEVRFQEEVHRLGGELLETRDAFFYPKALFFNSALHLNELGRRARTQTLIQALRKKLNPADVSISR